MQNFFCHFEAPLDHFVGVDAALWAQIRRNAAPQPGLAARNGTSGFSRTSTWPQSQKLIQSLQVNLLRPEID